MNKTTIAISLALSVLTVSLNAGKGNFKKGPCVTRGNCVSTIVTDMQDWATAGGKDYDEGDDRCGNLSGPGAPACGSRSTKLADE
jgi:hypothetical protein